MKPNRIAWAGLPAGKRARALAAHAVDLALAGDGLSGCLLVVKVVDDAESAALHAEHFDDPATTDVMTFPDGGDDPETGLRMLGDLAVCRDVAERVAAERGRPADEELALYVLHGVLHLLGHDDHDERDAAAMWAEQQRIMRVCGVEIGDRPRD